MSNPAPELAVIAPCLNEQEVIDEFIRRVTVACAGTGKLWEVILFDDGSRDGTWSKIRNHGVGLRDEYSGRAHRLLLFGS